MSTTCEDAAAEAVRAELAAMRAAMHESYMQWHASQPECWAEDRRQAEARRQWEQATAGDAVGHMWGTGLGLGTVGYGSGYGVLHGEHASAGAARTEAKTFSRTNNQVASVDEADIVKTDGRFVYFAANGALRIAEGMNPRIVSVTPLPGAVRELSVSGDRVVVYTSLGAHRPRCTYGYDCTFAGDGSRTSVTVLDVKDREHPVVARRLELSGSLVAARRIGSAVHTVVADGDREHGRYETWPEDLETCGTMEDVVRAKFAKLEQENERRIRAQAKTFSLPTVTENGREQAMCTSRVLRTAFRDGRAFTSVVSFDVDDDATPPTTATIQSRPGAVFASEGALYLAVVHRRSRAAPWYSWDTGADEVSEIHKLRIGAHAKDTRYVGSGTVPGHVLNQLAMDEWYGYLRVATTRGRVPDPRVSSVVSILAEQADGSLARVGATSGIAPGEDIRAVRFEGDRGYVVTFKKTDPLFVIDLADPGKPRVAGELEIPGFSTYLHRIDRDHLLSIGFDANDHGSFAYFDGVLLQLFDVAEPSRPKLLHREKIGTRGSSSEAATNHLAFTWFDEQSLLAVPMTVCEGGGDGQNGDHVAFSGLLVYDVDIERGFTKLGAVDHGPTGAPVSCGTWWSHATSAVKRSVFLDDLVYSVAGDRAKVQRTSALGTDLAVLDLGAP